MMNNGPQSISDAELGDVHALVGRGRAIPAVIVAAILRRLEAAEAVRHGEREEQPVFAL